LRTNGAAKGKKTRLKSSELQKKQVTKKLKSAKKPRAKEFAIVPGIQPKNLKIKRLGRSGQEGDKKWKNTEGPGQRPAIDKNQKEERQSGPSPPWGRKWERIGTRNLSGGVKRK